MTLNEVFEFFPKFFCFIKYKKTLLFMLSNFTCKINSITCTVSIMFTKMTIKGKFFV